jgi:hypothetical protein
MNPTRRPARLAIFLAALVSFAVALNVGADTPEPPNASMPCQIHLVGMAGGAADPAGEFSVVVRDLAQNPMAGVALHIVLNDCTDLRVAVIQPHPGVTVDCSSGPVGTVRAVTDASGTGTFRIVGGARNPTGAAPGAGFQCARVYADGVFLGRVNVGAFDQNGVSGVGPADLSVWLTDFYSGVYVGRSDFDCTHTLSPVDLSRLLSVSLSGSSGASAAAYCN